MAIEFFNIRSGERTRVDNPHTIAAYINSGDMHVNAGQGQDFGWRVSPYDVARINKLKADASQLENIARHLGKPVGDIKPVDFVKYISYLDSLAEQTQVINDGDVPAYQAQYEAELRALENADVPAPQAQPAAPTEVETTPTELPVALVKSTTPKAKK